MCGNAEAVTEVEREDVPECEGCGQPIEGEAVRVRRFDYCPECVTECDACGDTYVAEDVMLVHRHDGHESRDLCQHCRLECAHCGDELDPDDLDNATSEASGDTFCGACYSVHYCTCEDCGDVVHTDDANSRDCGVYCNACDPGEDEGDDDVGPIKPYHSSARHITPLRSPWTRSHGNRYLGVELEVERQRDAARPRGEIAQGISDWANRQAADITAEGHRAPILFFEEDGSIRHGFEMISQPMGLDDHARLWKAALSPTLTRGLVSHNTETCGLHVHISRDGLTALHLSKVICFVNDPDNADLIKAVARRYNGTASHIDGRTNYCKVGGRRRLARAFRDADDAGDKYVAVNVLKERTIEFRIFRGSLKYMAVMAAVEFTNAVVEFCRPGNPEGFNLKAPAFLDFIATAAMRRDTRHLRTYLTDRMRGHTFPAKFRPTGME
jgi:hypothetical protein